MPVCGARGRRARAAATAAAIQDSPAPEATGRGGRTSWPRLSRHKLRNRDPPVLRTCRRAMEVIRCPEPPAPARRRHRARRWPQRPPLASPTRHCATADVGRDWFLSETGGGGVERAKKGRAAPRSLAQTGADAGTPNQRARGQTCPSLPPSWRRCSAAGR